MKLEEKIEISKLIQAHAVFFRGLWDISYIEFTDELDTAAVYFDKDGSCLGMKICEKFWGELNKHEKAFIICHELCHFMLDHGKRFRDLNNKSVAEMRRVNRGADVNINETLVRCWGFDRTKFEHDIMKNLCWVDTVFTEDNGKLIKGIPVNESSDFYIKKLEELESDRMPSGGGEYILGTGMPFDDHKVIGEGAVDFKNLPPSISDQIKDFINQAAKEYSKVGKEHPFAKEAGIGSGGQFDIGKIKKVEKKKWETIIKNWAKKTLKETEDDTDRWDFQNRRYSSVLSGAKFMLPTEVNKSDDFYKKDKITVVFYLDTSGSCAHLAKRFFEAAASLPKDKFDLQLFCFDTKVYKTDLTGKGVYGFGGTSFSILTKHIADNFPKYPEAIFVISDGYGNALGEAPNRLKRWFWFLSEGGIDTYIKGCKIHQLKNFE